MSFASPKFFAFLAVLLVLLSFRLRLQQKKALLAIASCVFYAAWDFRCLGLLLFVSTLDYYCAARIHRTRTRFGKGGRAWLTLSLVSNLGLLAFFKYTNFLLESANSLFGSDIPHLEILLPAGISFYIFKTLSYTIDVYRGEIESVSSWMDYATFVTFFPELIAGPIVRASVFLPQMSRSIGPSLERLASGGSIFLLGLTKKVLIADRMASIADPIFADPAGFQAPVLWAACLAYTIQIYCDFSGYSDMAIGTARMLGYDLPENFAMPYLSRDISEFWRRWHITLSSWLRDYLYIPLGGNRGSRGRTYVNLVATMVLGGLWHGASWNFVVWGALHGLALAAHRLMRETFGQSFRLPRLLSTVVTFSFVSLLWIPFRSTSLATTLIMVRKMFSWSNEGMLWEPWYLYPAVALVALGHAAGMAISAAPTSAWTTALLARLGVRIERSDISGWYPRFSLFPAAGVVLIATWLLLVVLFASGNSKPFIYFQF
jgi:alginate O-acetyltransferase complex protein AlgI